jgi:glycosyltransferase involved in cell wall biosynthesis
MHRVLLLYNATLQNYRLPVFEYFTKQYYKDGIQFIIVCKGIADNQLAYKNIVNLKDMNFCSCWKTIQYYQPDIVILFTGINNFFIFPFIFLLKLIHIKVIYWGHGINLQKKQSWRFVYSFLHHCCHTIILYADHLKKYVTDSQLKKIFIAPNTLYLDELPDILPLATRNNILSKYGITTTKNIIFVGRMQRRKRINDLIEAHQLMNRSDIGVILVGDDIENVIPTQLTQGIIHIPALYGKELHKLMISCDVYCCPGAVGLNIVDAMACGLPFVTEAADHGPEIMYLKHGRNGMLVPLGRIDLLSDTLIKLLDDERLRKKMSNLAKETYRNDASIENMYYGFINAVRHSLKQ